MPWEKWYEGLRVNPAQDRTGGGEKEWDSSIDGLDYICSRQRRNAPGDIPQHLPCTWLPVKGSRALPILRHQVTEREGATVHRRRVDGDLLRGAGAMGHGREMDKGGSWLPCLATLSLAVCTGNGSKYLRYRGKPKWQAQPLQPGSCDCESRSSVLRISLRYLKE